MTIYASPATTRYPAALLADQFAPHDQFTRTRHRVIDSPTEEVYAAVRTLDLTGIHGIVADAARWLSGGPRRSRRDGISPFTVDDLESRTNWVILGERPGEEIAVGVAGRFWRPGAHWRRVEPRDFADFAEPGYGKFVVSVSVRAYGRRRSLVTHDIRVLLDDPESWQRFRRYWLVLAPFVGRFQNATLKAVDDAVRRP